MKHGLMAVALGALAIPSAANACGGFFCNASRPVDQAAEEILFDVDEAAGTVTMNVKIEYSGPSESFAWVVPVPEVPELKIGTNALFPVLSSLRAQWTLQRDLGDCRSYNYYSSSTASSAGGGGGGVEILSTGVVGPYETVVLSATDSGELVAWLQANEFDLPSTLDDALASYVSEGQYFVALRLAKDRDAGDLQPLVLTYPGTAISIPIQLTSLAATPDMGLRVYVLGDHRAVPESYLHLVLNELAIDWWTGGANLEQAITRAADEAGGHGFFTDYSGSPGVLGAQLWNASWDQLPAQIAAETDVASVLQTVLASGLPLDDDTLGVLGDGFGLPDVATDGFDLVDVVSCLVPYSYYGSYYYVDPSYCFAEELAGIEFDPVELGADLEERVLEPRRRIAGSLDQAAKITRMTSSLSPAEMTVDPTFVFNPDLADVDSNHVATETYVCSGDEGQSDLSDAPRVLTLSDGRSVTLPSLNELARQGISSIEWLDRMGLTEPVNARIERTGASGQPEVLQDNQDLLWGQVQGLLDGSGCGCASEGSAATGFLGLGLLSLTLRRRRS